MPIQRQLVNLGTETEVALRVKVIKKLTDVPDLQPLFSPRSVAVIGASTDPRKFGGFPIHYTTTRGYKGGLFPVNPTVKTLQGLQSYAGIGDIPGKVDCAIVSVPASRAEAAIEDCVAGGVRIAVMFSAGYAETGKAGARAQRRLVDIARAGGLRLLGPNCMGVFNRPLEFYGTFTSSFEHYGGDGFPRAGRTGIVSQSGAIGIHLMVLLRDRGVGTGKWVTTGNQSDIDVSDCVAWLAGDPETANIVLYLEGVPDGDRFAAALARADKAGKPVIVLKSGTSEAGARATRSHTASLAGRDAVFDGAVRQYGAIRATSMEDLASIASAFDAGIRPAARTLGVVSISGGAGALMADAAADAELRMPDLALPDRQKLLDIVPFCSPLNPIDTAGPGMTDMDIPLGFLDVALQSGKYATLALFLTHLGLIDRHWEKLAPGLIARAKEYPDVLLALSATATRERQAIMAAAGIPVFVEPVAAIRALGEVAGFAERHQGR